MSRAVNLSRAAIGLTGDENGNVTATGNLTLSGSAKRITGDFSNATVANRVMFQTSTANGNTLIRAIPNGTATQSSFQVINSSDAANCSLLQILATAGDTQLSSGINGTGTYLPMTFYTGGSERMRVDTSGNVSITNGNLVLASGKGIDFSANGNASGMSSELLDDYERGTWTPSFQINNVDSGATWTQKTGKYTKVGNLVNVWAYLYTSTGRGSGSGVVRIAGLPFAMGTLNGGNYHVADTRAGVSWSGGGAGLPFHYQPDGNTYLQFYSTANSTSSGTSGMTEANFSASGVIELNVMISYFVD